MERTHDTPSNRKQQTDAASPGAEVIEYVVTTAQGNAALWKPFRTLAGARRGLEKARALYPDAYITTTRSSQDRLA